MSSDSEISSVEQSDSEETDPEEEVENDDVDVEVVLSLILKLLQTDQMETRAYVFQA